MLALVRPSGRLRLGKPIPQAPQAVQTRRVRSDSTAAAAGCASRPWSSRRPQVPLSFRIPGYVLP